MIMGNTNYNKLSATNNINNELVLREMTLSRGIDTQLFEDDVFTMQELDQSILDEVKRVEYHSRPHSKGNNAFNTIFARGSG